MSAESRPIPAAQFALAIRDLPVENLYTKAHEIHNSVAHLERSNQQLQEYSDSIKNDTTLDDHVRNEGDKDCLEAIRENNIVIQRQQERVELLKSEVERRGGRWHEADTTESGATNGTVNGVAEDVAPQATVASTSFNAPSMTDEELRRRLEEQMASDEESGMHL